MSQNVKIYKENYENLPGRFIEKIEHDIRYLLERDIAGLKRVYLFGSCARGNVRSRRSATGRLPPIYAGHWTSR